MSTFISSAAFASTVPIDVSHKGSATIIAADSFVESQLITPLDSIKGDRLSTISTSKPENEVTTTG